MASLFVSHGAPTFAVEPGRAGAGPAAVGRALPRPEAVLVVSPHWTTDEPRVTAAAWPETLHDFGGFDPALYDIIYPAPGDPALASRTAEATVGKTPSPITQANTGTETRGLPKRTGRLPTP